MDARPARVAVVAAVLLVSMGARFRTPNFIVQTPDPRLARQFAEAAEKHRRDLAVAWLGKSMPNWAAPCKMTVQVGPRLGAGGATKFVFGGGEVFGWQMTIQGSHQRILDSVLPHEITHMIFASRFRRPLPRWADEGGATSVEHASELDKHRKMLHHYLRSGRGIAFNRMFAITEYPKDIMPLYAQGYSVADLLIQKGGRRKYVEFLAAGLNTGDWSGAVRRHYGVAGAGALQDTWLAWVRQGCPRLKSAARPSPETLAGNARLPRPVPNLIFRTSKQAPEPYLPGSVRLLGRPPVPAVQLASAAARPEPKLLPTSGWHAAGTEPPPIAAKTAPPPAARTLPRTHVTRPQHYQPAQQIILGGCTIGGG